MHEGGGRWVGSNKLVEPKKKKKKYIYIYKSKKREKQSSRRNSVSKALKAKVSCPSWPGGSWREPSGNALEAEPGKGAQVISPARGGICATILRTEGTTGRLLSLEKWDCVCILESSFPGTGDCRGRVEGQS